jgi:integrase
MSLFSSVFALKLEAMLDYRVSCGYKRDTCTHHFIRFDQYCRETLCETPELTGTLVHGWLESKYVQRDISGRAMAIRQFGKYLCAIGEDAYILPDKFSPGRRAKPPYIFTDNEMTRLFAAIDTLPPTNGEPYFNQIAPVLFRLTYTCGLRPNESRELPRENICLDSGEILVANTKGNKERIVVMSGDMLAMCKEYDLRRNIFGGDNPYFFPSHDGGALTSSMIYAAFNKAWKAATQTKGSMRGRNVRVYDLRHRFASACLNRWLDNGENLMVMLPYLRAYMGHDQMDETAYYIHILPENLVKSSAIDWDAFNGMFPEVVL